MLSVIFVRTSALGPSPSGHVTSGTTDWERNACTLVFCFCGRLRDASTESSGSLPFFLGLGTQVESMPSMGISTLSGALAAGICDFDTPLISVKASSKLFANCCRFIIL